MDVSLEKNDSTRFEDNYMCEVGLHEEVYVNNDFSLCFTFMLVDILEIHTMHTFGTCDS